MCSIYILYIQWNLPNVVTLGTIKCGCPRQVAGLLGYLYNAAIKTIDHFTPCFQRDRPRVINTAYINFAKRNITRENTVGLEPRLGTRYIKRLQDLVK